MTFSIKTFPPSHPVQSIRDSVPLCRGRSRGHPRRPILSVPSVPSVSPVPSL